MKIYMENALMTANKKGYLVKGSLLLILSGP